MALGLDHGMNTWVRRRLVVDEAETRPSGEESD